MATDNEVKQKVQERSQQLTGSVAAEQRAAKATPSGYLGDNPSTAGPGQTGIRSATPENSSGQINPSAPGDTGTTPNTTPRENQE
jgi:hypothetical protein